MKRLLVGIMLIGWGGAARGAIVLSGPYCDGNGTFRLIVSGLASDVHGGGVCGGVYHQLGADGPGRGGFSALPAAGAFVDVQWVEYGMLAGYEFTIVCLEPDCMTDGDWIEFSFHWDPILYSTVAFELWDYDVIEPVQTLDATCMLDPMDCYTGPDYDEWVSVGRPESWCRRTQACGDADGLQEPLGFGQFTWVGAKDLALLVAAYRARIGGPNENLACDFDHRQAMLGFWQLTRVGPEDVAILVKYYRTRVDMMPEECR